MKVRRAALGINQEELAFLSGVNRTFVGRLEIGTSSPSLTTLFRIAEGLNMGPADLIEAVATRFAKELRAEHRRELGQGAKVAALTRPRRS
jgi:transcriptional regulator with XRE-family HTH domain